MSYIFVQDSGHMYLIPDQKTVERIFNDGTFELYRVDNRSEGLVEDESDLKNLQENDTEIGIEIGNILDIDLDILKEVVFIKTFGCDNKQFSKNIKMEVDPYKDGVTERFGCVYSYSLNLWFDNSFKTPEQLEILNRIIERNNEY